MHWYERSFRRNLLDFHVDDWHPDFLSRFDPVQFAESVLSLRSTAATVFANTHTGLSNHPTTTGEMHAGLQGRDVLGATVDELHRRGIDVVMYYVAIFADWYWDNHPEARVVDANGVAQKVIVDHGRQAAALQHDLSQRTGIPEVRGGPDRGDLRSVPVRGRLARHDVLADGLLLRIL